MNHKASQVLSDAFAKDPWIVYLIGHNPQKRLRFFNCLLELAEHTSQKLLTVYQDQELAGVAIIETPDSMGLTKMSFTKVAALSKVIMRLLATVGLKRFGALNQYMRITTRHRPKEKHHYLVCVGVSPKYWGLGLGKHLITQAIATATSDTDAMGIGLDTELEANVTLYKNMGFDLVGTESILKDLKIFTMFHTK